MGPTLLLGEDSNLQLLESSLYRLGHLPDHRLSNISNNQKGCNSISRHLHWLRVLLGLVLLAQLRPPDRSVLTDHSHCRIHTANHRQGAHRNFACVLWFRVLGPLPVLGLIPVQGPVDGHVHMLRSDEWRLTARHLL